MIWSGHEPSSITKYMVGRIGTLAWPVVGEMICLVIGGVLTTAMVGRFGAVEVASVGLSTMLQATCAMIMSAAGSGTGSLVARAYGARQIDDARYIAGQAIIIALFFGSLMSALCYYAGRIAIAIASPDAAVIEMASGFIAIMALFLPFNSIVSVNLGVIRGTGKTRIAMLVAVAGQAISLSVTYTLLFVLEIGVWGAIFGMASSQALVSLISFLAVRSCWIIGLRLRHIFPLRRDVIYNVLKISAVNASEQIAVQSGRIGFALLMASAGAAQFAGHNVALQVESISFMPGMAFGIAAMNLVSYNLGRGVPHRAQQYAWLTMGISVVAMGLMGILFYFMAEPLTRFFIDDPEVLKWGAACVRIAAIEQAALAISLVLASVLRGAGDAMTSMYVALFGTWCLRIPLILLLKYIGCFNVANGWLCAFLDMVVRALLFIYIVRRKDWRKMKSGVYF